jgi:uncharacterized protein (DUF1330 family)
MMLISLPLVGSYTRTRAATTEYGGRDRVRGGGAERLEGDAHMNRLITLEFPGMARLKAFYNSAHYQLLLAIRRRAAISTLPAIQGV